MKQPTNYQADLEVRIGKIYDHLYGNAETKTPHGICKEVGKILHIGIFLEEIHKKIPGFNFSEKLLPKFDESATDQSQLIGREMKRVFETMNKNWRLYEKDESINLSNFDIAFSCLQLDGIYLSDPSKDVFGDAIEIIRSQWAKQIGGQFFTDARVTRMAMHLLEFDPRKGDDLLDICCGTGGFLLSALNHIRELLEKDGEEGKNIEKDLVSLARKSLRGQEIDPEVLSIARATMESRIGKNDIHMIQQGDSLKKTSFKQNGIEYNSQSCLATNPPFGTKITIKDPSILCDYDIARIGNSGGNAAVAPRAPDILFLEQNLKLLIPGKGRLAFISPYQILSGPQTRFVREWLWKNAEIMAVIDLPAETFQPHTGTKTCLLVVKRRLKPLQNIEESEDFQIFMSAPKWIGHDRRGNPVYKRHQDGSLSHDILSDINDVIEAFGAYRKGEDPAKCHSNSFVISSKQVLEDPMLHLNARYFEQDGQLVQRSKLNSLSGWKLQSIENVVERIFYPGRFKRNYVEHFPGAIPFLGGSNITELVSTSDKWLSPDDPKLNDLRIHAGWILITRSGSTGIVSSVPLAWDGFAMSEHVIRIVPDPKKLAPEYLLAFLRTPYCQKILSRGVFGSVIDEITPEFVGGIQVPISTNSDDFIRVVDQISLAEKARNNAIVSILSSVERLNKSLQEMEVAYA